MEENGDIELGHHVAVVNIGKPSISLRKVRYKSTNRSILFLMWLAII